MTEIFQIKRIKSKRDRDIIFDMVDHAFLNICPIPHLYVKGIVNWRISRKVMLKDQIVGFYLLRKSHCNIPEKYKLDPKLKGAQGLALYLDPRYRGKGIGKQLMDLPKTLGFDYVWGGQAKGLNNLNYWLKRRILIDENDFCYHTLEIFNPENLVLDKQTELMYK